MPSHEKLYEKRSICFPVREKIDDAGKQNVALPLWMACSGAKKSVIN